MTEPELARALFAPRAVALIGASDDPVKNTGRPQRFLAAHGYDGRVVPINPNRETVQGLPAYARLSEAPGPIDQAFIMVPAPAVIGAIEECARAGVAVATIYSDGFAETGEDGAARQQEIVAAARAGGVRLIGPNSMGVISPAGALPLSVNAVLEMDHLPKGKLGLVSQSGTILGTLMSRGAARGFGFSHMVSVGNEADLSVGEIAGLMVDDPDTHAIVLFLEAIRDPDGLAHMAGRAAAAGKPVIAYKLGRSAAGRELAVSHSGALAGDDRAAAAFFEAHGIYRVHMLEALLEMPPLVLGSPEAAGRRVAVVTTTGGGAATVADQMAALGLELVSAPASVRRRLSALGLELGDGPLVDLTMAGTREGVYGAALEELLAAPECDAVVAVVGSSAQFHPELAVEPIVAAARNIKPLAVFLVPDAPQSLRVLADAGLAAFRTPEACADALRAALTRRPHQVLTDGEAPALSGPASALDAWSARGAFQTLGIEQAPAALLPEGTANLPDGLAYPVALKLVAPGLAHKTEIGGVRLDVADDEALRIAAADLRAAAEAHGISGAAVMVQNMETASGEVLVGFHRDPEVGPVVVLAAGGVLAEVYDDASLRLAPVDITGARAMIEEVKGLAPLRGYRSLPAGDLDALAAAIVAVSRLALVRDPEIEEAEINPLFVRRDGAGVVAVDGLIRRADNDAA